MMKKLDPNQDSPLTKIYGTHISEAIQAEEGKVLRQYALISIDNTIRAAWRRDELLNNPNFSWDEYHADAIHDDQIRDMVSIANALEAFGFIVVCWNASPEKWRQLNMDWLVTEGLQNDELWLRPDDDFSSHAECKYKMALEKFGSDEGIRQNVVLVIDDNEEVCQKFIEIGVTALQVFARRDY